MFGLKRRVKILEEKMANIEQEKACAADKHDWKMVESSLGDPPFIRCSACRAFPPSEGKA